MGAVGAVGAVNSGNVGVEVGGAVGPVIYGQHIESILHALG